MTATTTPFAIDMLDMVDLYTPRGLLYIQHIQPGARLKGLFFPKTIATTSADRCLVELLSVTAISTWRPTPLAPGCLPAFR